MRRNSLAHTHQLLEPPTRLCLKRHITRWPEREVTSTATRGTSVEPFPIRMGGYEMVGRC